MEWLQRMNSVVTITNRDVQYKIPVESSAWQTGPEKKLLETWTMWRQYEQSVISISNSD
jgi:hypothetical protein